MSKVAIKRLPFATKRRPATSSFVQALTPDHQLDDSPPFCVVEIDASQAPPALQFRVEVHEFHIATQPTAVAPPPREPGEPVELRGAGPVDHNLSSNQLRPGEIWEAAAECVWRAPHALQCRGLNAILRTPRQLQWLNSVRFGNVAREAIRTTEAGTRWRLLRRTKTPLFATPPYEIERSVRAAMGDCGPQKTATGRSWRTQPCGLIQTLQVEPGDFTSAPYHCLTLSLMSTNAGSLRFCDWCANPLSPSASRSLLTSGPR